MRLPGKDLLRRALLARKVEGVGLIPQLVDLLRIHFGDYHIDRTDYYNLRLYKVLRHRNTARKFVGSSRQWQVNKALNDRRGVLAAYDKRVMDALLRDAGIPLPKIKASYIPSPTPSPGNGSLLTTRDELIRFLCDPGHYPFFAKAAFSQQGHHLLHAVELRDGKIVDDKGHEITVDGFLEGMVDRSSQFYAREHGWIFQEVLEQHSVVTQATGTGAISCARIVALRQADDEYKAIQAVWKVASPGSTTDHFREGHGGNRIARVDLSTGRVDQAVKGFWPYAAEVHSDELDGFVLPDWDAAIRAVTQAAGLLPFMTIQHWDVAFSADGPVLVEVNDLGGCEGLQLHGRGLLEGEIADALRERYRRVLRSETNLFPSERAQWLKQYAWIANV